MSFLALCLGLVSILAGPAAPASAAECGCAATGSWASPTTATPAAQATSPAGGKYSLQTSQAGTQLTLTLKKSNTGSVVESFTIPLLRAAWGFSPDGDRFMFRYALAGSTTMDTVTLYDLAADRRVYESSAAAGFAAAFSPHGRWFFLDVLNGTGNAQIDVINAVTGATALDTTVIFKAVPGDPGDKYGSMGTGFSSEDGDRSFVWAYRSVNGSIELNVRNLSSGATVLSQTILNGVGAFWRFSPCGDAFGLVTQPFTNTVAARVVQTASSGSSGVEKDFSPIPATITFSTTSSWHQVQTTDSRGTTTTTNIIQNTAGKACPK